MTDEGPDHIAPEDRCTECAGWGGWTETNAHGTDIDFPCHHCGEAGIEP